jgi:hypothetical protein
MKRISFSNLERWYGLVISGTTLRGAVVSATLNGEQIGPVGPVSYAAIFVQQRSDMIFKRLSLLCKAP